MNSFTSPIYNLAFISLVVTGINFTFLLWFTNRINRSANRLLALALAVMVAWMVHMLTDMVWLPLPFSLALGPLLYLYVRKRTQPDYTFSRNDWLHFIPVVAEQVFWSKPVVPYFTVCSIVTYLYLSDQLIERFYRRLTVNGSDRYRNEFRWLHRLLAVFGWLWLLWIPYAGVNYFVYQGQLAIQACYPLYILLAAQLIRIGVVAYLRPEVSLPPTPSPPVKSPPVELKGKGVWLKKVVKENRYYEDPELSLSLLADKLALSPHELSRIINTILKKSFNDFINDYRVADVVQKMQDPAYDRITLLGMAYDSGFNSRTTFHRIFKKVTGKSPADYKAELKKEPSPYTLEPYPRFVGIKLSQKTTSRWSDETFSPTLTVKIYLKIAWRSITGNKVYSALNISGLAAGIAVTLLISLWAWHQYSYDRFLPNYTQLYQIKLNFDQNGTIQTQSGGCLPIAAALRGSFPEVKYVAETGWTSRHSLISGHKKLYQPGMIVGRDFLTMFQFHLLSGNAATVLKEPFSIVLTQSTAKALFGNEDPIGKLVRIDNVHTVKVSGLLENTPDHSTLQFSYLLPFSYWEQTQPWVKRARTDWTHYPFDQYIELQPGVTEEQVAPKLKNLLKGHDPIHKVEIVLHPVKNWHLYSEFKNGKASGGLIVYVRMFSIIGVLVLLIACINFVNLFTARSEKKAREVGVRKTIGSNRASLIFQFLTESVLVTCLAALFAIAIVHLSLPAFNSLTGNALKLPYGEPLFWLSMLMFSLLTGVVAGSRPAFYLSSFKPVNVLRGTLPVGKAAVLPRNILVITQFSCSIALLIGTIIIYQQISYVKNRPSGYDADRLVMTPMTADLSRHYTALKNDLLGSGLVVNVTKSSGPVTDFVASCNLVNWPGRNAKETKAMCYDAVSEDYFKTAGMTLKEGRDFRGTSTDTLNAILNEAAVGQLRLKAPVGQMLTTELSREPVRIIGVVKDAVIGSPFSALQPALFVYNPDRANTVIYRLKPDVNVQDVIRNLAPIFTNYNPAYPYDYWFADTTYASKFKQAQLVGKLAAVFAGLTILISCLGLFGLAAYMAEQRRKEIGVRKVLGASVGSIWLLLSKEFMVLVLIGYVIAAPLALYFMRGWLQQYDYRITIGWSVFVLSALLAILITLLTISFQSIKAALANPVNSLGSE